ncbi:hypothetical protein ACJRO7_004035 [Eucalyptus globulus]|uniref:Uncharacterized protein n=1 Tax=Eucalyptus globulus TaxID=34317 RepID=A0ABD3IZT4_EUCGL
MRKRAKRSASQRDSAPSSSQQRHKRVKLSRPEAEPEHVEEETGLVNFGHPRRSRIHVCAAMMCLASGEFGAIAPVEVPVSVVILLLLEIL